MSRDHELSELNDVRIPGELLRSLNQLTSDFQTRILRQAARRAAAKSANRPCVLGKDDLTESIQAAFREGPAEWLKALSPDELSHVRRAS